MQVQWRHCKQGHWPTVLLVGERPAFPLGNMLSILMIQFRKLPDYHYISKTWKRMCGRMQYTIWRKGFKQRFRVSPPPSFLFAGASAFCTTSPRFMLCQPRHLHQSRAASGGSWLPLAWGIHPHPQDFAQPSSSEQQAGNWASDPGGPRQRGMSGNWPFLAVIQARQQNVVWLVLGARLLVFY